eukprot:EG_transcript_11323
MAGLPLLHDPALAAPSRTPGASLGRSIAVFAALGSSVLLGVLLPHHSATSFRVARPIQVPVAATAGASFLPPAGRSVPRPTAGQEVSSSRQGIQEAPRPRPLAGAGPLLAVLGGALALAVAAVHLPAGKPREMRMAAVAADSASTEHDVLIQQMLQMDDEALKATAMQNLGIMKAPFFLRIEQLKQAAPAAQRAQYDAVADKILGLMQKVVEQVQSKVDHHAVRIAGLVGIFAKEDGSISVPLPKDGLARLREDIRRDLSALSNDLFVNAVAMFLAKASEEKKPELTAVMQKIVEAYSAESLLIMCPHGGEGALPKNIMVWNILLNSDQSEWDSVLRQHFPTADAGELDAFLAMLDAGVGAVVYEQSKGMIQKMLAQYVFQIIQAVQGLRGAPA